VATKKVRDAIRSIQAEDSCLEPGVPAVLGTLKEILLDSNLPYVTDGVPAMKHPLRKRHGNFLFRLARRLPTVREWLHWVALPHSGHFEPRAGKAGKSQQMDHKGDGARHCAGEVMNTDVDPEEDESFGKNHLGFPTQRRPAEHRRTMIMEVLQGLKHGYRLSHTC